MAKMINFVIFYLFKKKKKKPDTWILENSLLKSKLSPPQNRGHKLHPVQKLGEVGQETEGHTQVPPYSLHTEYLPLQQFSIVRMFRWNIVWKKNTTA